MRALGGGLSGAAGDADVSASTRSTISQLIHSASYGTPSTYPNGRFCLKSARTGIDGK